MKEPQECVTCGRMRITDVQKQASYGGRNPDDIRCRCIDGRVERKKREPIDLTCKGVCFIYWLPEGQKHKEFCRYSDESLNPVRGETDEKAKRSVANLSSELALKAMLDQLATKPPFNED
jgi:hypothetical protein